MNKEPRDWVQIAGHVGLIASLLFVGFQLKQDREIAIAATFQDRATAVSQAMSAFAANAVAVKANIKITTGLDPNTPSPTLLRNIGIDPQLDLTTFEVFTSVINKLSIWFMWDNSHYQYTTGFLPEEHWVRIRADIKRALKGDPVTVFAYRDNVVLNRAGFREVIVELLAEIEQENELEAE